MNTTGYARGDSYAPGREWLTIWGSHWAEPVLADTPQEIVQVHGYTVARVERVWHPGVESGRAFRILEIVSVGEADAP